MEVGGLIVRWDERGAGFDVLSFEIQRENVGVVFVQPRDRARNENLGEILYDKRNQRESSKDREGL